jgi:signal transduction histidine kinase
VRRRLMMAFVGLVIGVLMIAGVGSLVLTRDAARRQASQQLVAEAQSLTSGASHSESLTVLRVVRRVLRLEDARLVRVGALGAVLSAAPPGLTSTDLDPQALLAGQTVSGEVGDLVYAAAPVHLTQVDRERLRVGGVIAVVLTRQAGDLGPSWVYFIAAGGAALLLAALVAWLMSRRLSRPLAEAIVATSRIAAGDLESRVPVQGGRDTELSSLGRSINEMARSLEDGRRRERDLLLSVSHDLRTPLTSIRGFAEAILDGAVDDSVQAASVIMAESRHLERLVGDLLDLTKLEARQLSIHVRPTDLAEVVATTTEGVRPLAERNGLTLSVQLPAVAGSPVLTDPDRLAQILANLVENAVTFARTSVVVSLRGPTAVGTRGPQAIVVEDDGPGIAREDLGHVFERFYQGDRGPRRQAGSGLGLAIVGELAGAVGATVRVESPTISSGGSRFVVTLTGSIDQMPLGRS